MLSAAAKIKLSFAHQRTYTWQKQMMVDDDDKDNQNIYQFPYKQVKWIKTSEVLEKLNKGQKTCYLRRQKQSLRKPKRQVIIKLQRG